MGARPRAGLLEAQAAPDLGIPCGWNCVWDLNVFYFQKPYFIFENPSKSVLTPKIVKPFPEIF
jgi:hypothetical protein